MSGDQESKRFQLMLELTEEFEQESDRAAAVLAAAYLDDLLKDLIIASMPIKPETNDDKKRMLEGENALLSDFSSKIDVAYYCLAAISKDEERDLNLIRKIRNEFAHKLTDLSFDTGFIANRCRELKSAQIDGRPPTMRECFRKAAVRLMVEMILRIEVKSRRADPAKTENDREGH